MTFRLRSLAFTLPALLFAADAAATRQPDYLDERPVETAAGARGRSYRDIGWQAPASMARLWQDFIDAHGDWRGMWDQDTGVPLRIWGEGIPTPGASADPVRAEAAARAILAERLALLAPGAKLDDFRLVTNVVHGRTGDLRTVAFVQTYGGLRVLGGQVSFLFEQDRLIVLGSEAAPRVDVTIPTTAITAADALGRAQAWIASAYGAVPTLLADRGLAILPLVRDASDSAPRLEFRAVRILSLDLADPRARWDVYLDAATGAPVARHQTLMFGAGTVRFNTPVRYPRGMRQDDAAPQLNVMVNGASAVSTLAGGLTWAGTAQATVTHGIAGTLVRITTGNGNGATATNSMMIDDGGTGIWNAAAQPTVDSQLIGFVHANRIKAIAKADLAPDLAWLGGQIQVNVNESGSCNAYSTGDDIHFFTASGQCENTGRIPDVIYHEFGHSLHAHSVIAGVGGDDGSLGEGVADYLAATTVDDPGMGRGFFLGNASPLRDLDPAGREARWPDDIDPNGDPHGTGEIIGGALWDLRKEFITLLGAGPGKQKADDAYYAILQRAADIPSTYVEVLAADDNDGNLANGTPNKCLIDRAFGPHGLIDPTLGLGLAAPVRTGNDVTVSVNPPPGDCPAPAISSVVLSWRLRGQGALQTVPLTRTGNAFKAAIPTQPDGSVVEYKVAVSIANGTHVDYPDNVADPLYQYYIGPLVPVYCTDFETDPFAAGWTHQAVSNRDDWQWGVPGGAAGSGDPAMAASGSKAIGNDLGNNGSDGMYVPSMSDFALSPVIDVSHATGVRLQYKRWLGVEDGFYDDAEVFADGQKLWSNFDTGNQDASTEHVDREWRFQDLDLSAQAADGSVQIKFALTSDEGLQLGGWTIDDFCIMARTNILPGCGNGTVDGAEQCDDGNNVAGDGCTESCTIEPGVDPGTAGGGCCSTGGSPAAPIGLGLLSAFFLLRKRDRLRGRN